MPGSSDALRTTPDGEAYQVDPYVAAPVLAQMGLVQ